MNIATTESDSFTVHNNHNTPSTSNTIVINGGVITGTSSSPLTLSTSASSNSAFDELPAINTTDALLAFLYPADLSSSSETLSHDSSEPLSYASVPSSLNPEVESLPPLSASSNFSSKVPVSMFNHSTTTTTTTITPSNYSPSSTLIPPSSSASNSTQFTSATSSSSTSTTTDSIQAAASEHRLRWIDYRNRPAYPPRVPPVPGIPSGFRNPVTPTYLSPSGASIPQSPLYHSPPFGGSSTNPVGFTGSAPASGASSGPSFLSSSSNGLSRKPNLNLTRVERKSKS